MRPQRLHPLLVSSLPGKIRPLRKANHTNQEELPKSMHSSSTNTSQRRGLSSSDKYELHHYYNEIPHGNFAGARFKISKNLNMEVGTGFALSYTRNKTEPVEVRAHRMLLSCMKASWRSWSSCGSQLCTKLAWTKLDEPSKFFAVQTLSFADHIYTNAMKKHLFSESLGTKVAYLERYSCNLDPNTDSSNPNHCHLPLEVPLIVN